MSADFEDWTNGITIITGATPMGADFPDWTTAISVATGGGAGYASLTGTGQTTTPGDLTQAGGFTVDDTVGHGIDLATASEAIVQTTAGGDIIVRTLNGGGFGVQTTFGGSLGMVLDNSNGTGTQILDSTADGIRIRDHSVVAGNGVIISSDINPVSIGTANGVSITGGGGSSFEAPGLSIVDTAAVGASGGIGIQSNHHAISVQCPGNLNLNVPAGGSGQISLTNNGSGGIALQLNSGTQLTITGLPTTNPGGSGRVWNNGGVLNIT